MKSGIINAQKSVIRLQEELLDKSTEELDSVQRTVKTTVENTVQAEFQSYSAVHKKILTSSNCLETSINLIKLRTKALLLQSQAADLKDTWTPNNFKLQ